MSLAFIYVIIALIVSTVWVVYTRDYYKGLYISVFFLLFLPDRLSINLGVGIPAFTIHRLIIAVMIIHWLRNKELKKALRDIPFLKLQIVISICFLISTIFSDEFSISFNRFGYYILESVIFFWMVQTSLYQREQVDKLIKTLALSLLVVACLGILERYTGFNINSYLPQKGDYGLTSFSSITGLSSGVGVSATYKHRILFGIACAVCTIIYFAKATLESEARIKVAFWVACVVGFSGLFFSTSRGPWVAFLASVGFLCVIQAKRFIVTTAIFALIVISIFVIKPGAWVAIQEMNETTFDETSTKGASYNWRFQVWDSAWDRTVSADPIHKLFGYGGGSHLYMDKVEITMSTGYKSKIESWDCQFAIDVFEHGLIGFFLMIWMLFYANFLSLRYIRRNGQLSRQVVYAIASIMVIIVAKISVSFFAPQLVYIEAIMFAVISRVLMLPEENSAMTRP